MAKQKGTSPKSNKIVWSYIAGGITFLGIVLALLNDSFDLIDRFMHKSTPQPISQVQSEILVSDYFPLFVGSTKTYNVAGRTPTVGGGPIVQTNSTYTEKIIMTVSGTDEDIHIYQVQQDGGEIYDMDCTGFETRPSPSEKWYISYHSSFFVACTEEEKGKIISDLMNQKYSGTKTPDFSKISPILIFPLVVENQWSAFPGMPVNNDDHSYNWYVEEKLDSNLGYIPRRSAA